MKSTWFMTLTYITLLSYMAVSSKITTDGTHFFNYWGSQLTLDQLYCLKNTGHLDYSFVDVIFSSDNSSYTTLGNLSLIANVQNSLPDILWILHAKIPANSQVANLLLSVNSKEYDMVWIDVEYGDFKMSCQVLVMLVNQIKAIGKNVGIFTDRQ